MMNNIEIEIKTLESSNNLKSNEISDLQVSLISAEKNLTEKENELNEKNSDLTLYAAKLKRSTKTVSLIGDSSQI